MLKAVALAVSWLVFVWCAGYLAAAAMVLHGKAMGITVFVALLGSMATFLLLDQDQSYAESRGYKNDLVEEEQ